MDAFFIVTTVLSSIFLLAYILLIIRYTYGWKQLETFSIHPSIMSKLKTKVSIIIAVRNEEDNILNLLHALVLQKYNTSLYQIIIVDDHSEDKTVELVEEFIDKNPDHSIQLAQLSKINPKLQNKKAAINEGIKLSKNELIVTTDADCIMSENWLCTIAAYYETFQPKIIAAPVLLNGNSFFQQLQQLEFLSLMGATAGAIKIRKPLMCNGANLAYTRKIFDEIDGFESNSNIATGDDTFIMFKIWNKYKNGIHFLKSTDSVVTTNAKGTIADFFHQRTRWASKTNKYKVNHVIRVAYLIVITNLLVMIIAIMAIFKVNFIVLLITLFLAKLICDSLLLTSIARFFQKEHLMRVHILLTSGVFYPIYILIVGFKSQLGLYQWKDRKSTKK